jgi:hypothetical protein
MLFTPNHFRMPRRKKAHSRFIRRHSNRDIVTACLRVSGVKGHEAEFRSAQRHCFALATRSSIASATLVPCSTALEERLAVRYNTDTASYRNSRSLTWLVTGPGGGTAKGFQSDGRLRRAKLISFGIRRGLQTESARKTTRGSPHEVTPKSARGTLQEMGSYQGTVSQRRRR